MRAIVISVTLVYRVVVIMSQKHMTKHFGVAKKYCAQWQL